MLLLTAVVTVVVFAWGADDYRDALAIRLVVVAAGAAALFALLDRIRARGRPGSAGPFERVAAGPPSGPPTALRYDQLRRLAELSGSASTVHVHLRPVITDIATERFLVDRHLTVTDPGAGELVPRRTWDLVRPDRARPRDADAAGLPPGELDAVLDELFGPAGR